MDIKNILIAFLLTVVSPSFAQEVAETEVDAAPQMSAEEKEYIAWAQKMWDSLDRQVGEIKIPQAKATFTVPDSFYFLNASDAEKVLVEVWENPSDTTVLGMLFPAEMTPFDYDSWAVTIQYDEDGYVSDADAADVDYTELLAQMKKEAHEASKERVKQGYGAIQLIGWAAEPHYDGEENKMYWAKEISFAGQEMNTLNYNIRVLGRKGVLVLNFIANMEQKPLIEQNLDKVLALAEFDAGSRYGDFNPDIDTVAAYGIGALVAGKIAAKTGLIALALVFLKKFGIFIFIGLAGLFKWIFSRKTE